MQDMYKCTSKAESNGHRPTTTNMYCALGLGMQETNKIRPQAYTN